MSRDKTLRARILVVEDDPTGRIALERILVRADYEVRSVEDGREALAVLGAESFDLVVSDVRMPHLSGLELLQAVHRSHLRLPVILMTAFGTVSEAVSAMKMGAVDFLSKPFRRQQLLDLVEKALKDQKIWMQKKLDHGQYMSPAMRQLEDQVRRMATSPASVVIQGESGSGKERVARALHEGNSNHAGPFVAINCGALPEGIIEAELFGAEAGAYTGASKSRPGLIESADGGTLFLDEIAELPLLLQVKLLRVIQDQKIRRVGGREERRVNLRWIAASHRDLSFEVKEGRFREDLFFRLNVLNLEVPPLRKRAEDFPVLIEEIMSSLRDRYPGQKDVKLTQTAYQCLVAFDWPGNVRQLENTLERAFVLSDEGDLGLDALPLEMIGLAGSCENVQMGAAAAEDLRIPLNVSLKDVEEQMIERALKVTGGDKALAAKLLGVNARTIYRRLEKNRPSPNEDNTEGRSPEFPQP